MTAAARGGVRYESGLVEAAVLCCVECASRPDRERFRSRRDALYGIADADERDAAFEALHGEWFLVLGLDRPLHRALAERPDVAALGECRVLAARARRDEMADLVAAAPDAEPRVLVVRLRPESFLDANALAELLRRELLHVADMLDPAFGYQPELPASSEGPSYDNVLRDRYRAVWTATVAGRLARAGGAQVAALERARADFCRAFGPLGEGAVAAFQRWLAEPRPTHAAILGFILDPARGGRADGRCPLCRFPSALAGATPGAAVRRAILREHPGWSPAAGICPQCRDLYAAVAQRAARRDPQEGGASASA